MGKALRAHWNQDVDAALYYLASIRHIGPSQVIVIGRGLGGTIAANLTLKHPEIERLVMIDPQPPTLGCFRAALDTYPARASARARSLRSSDALSSRSVDKLFLVAPNMPTPGYVASAAPPATAVHGTVLEHLRTPPRSSDSSHRTHANPNH